MQHIPTKFASKYLHEISELITLQDSSGKQWPVRCIFKRHASKLSQGWSQFVRDNHLEEGDVCVFELMEKKNVVLKVTMFRVSSHLVTSETKLQSEVQA